MDFSIALGLGFGIVIGFAILIAWSRLELKLEQLDDENKKLQLDIEDLYFGRERARKGITPNARQLQDTGPRERSSAGDRDSS